MMATHKIIDRVLTLSLLIILSSLIWTQVSASPAAAQEPEAGEPSLSLQIIPGEDAAGIAQLGAAPVFDVGDIFEVSVVALGVEEPGIFGSQFEIQYDPNFLKAVEGSLTPGSATEPVINPVKEIDLENGLIRFAASRQGDLDNLAGNVVLARVSFEAVGATEPPEGQTTTIDLQNVKLGAKGGIAVPVSGLVDLDVIIRDDDGNQPGPGDIIGNVKVEGRPADNQAGHPVTAVGTLNNSLSDTTEANGDFWIDNAPADTYDLTVDSPGFLAAGCEGVIHTVDTLTDLADVTLLAGDIDDSHTIDITDAVAIGAVFGSTDPQVADLNADGIVDILDLILMAANFGQTSISNPWVCQLAIGL